jgi:hypothetical protein
MDEKMRKSIQITKLNCKGPGIPFSFTTKEIIWEKFLLFLQYKTK